jgi:hypothetical protein
MALLEAAVAVGVEVLTQTQELHFILPLAMVGVQELELVEMVLILKTQLRQMLQQVMEVVVAVGL